MASAARSSAPFLLSLYDQKRLKLDEMVTRTYPLAAAGLTQAFADMKAGRNAKGVLIPATVTLRH